MTRLDRLTRDLAAARAAVAILSGIRQIPVKPPKVRRRVWRRHAWPKPPRQRRRRKAA